VITAVTCTGDRPIPFGLCVEYMSRQKRKPDQWVIVDDGKAPLSHERERLQQYCGIADVQIIRRLPARSDPAHTLPVNLLTALDHVSNDRVAFVEDDDWYSCDHIAMVNDGLKAHELFGFQGIVYYHVGKQCHRTMGAAHPHSSLCQTGITQAVFPLLKRICSGGTGFFVDLRLWHEFAGTKKLWNNLGSVVGIKGLPGRVGLSAGWRNVVGYTPDPSLKFLESLIGPDVENYRPFHVKH
jgi:hypothetical protein